MNQYPNSFPNNSFNVYPLKEWPLKFVDLPNIFEGQPILACAIDKKFVLIATKTSLFCRDTEKNITFSTSAPKAILIKVVECKNSKAPIKTFGD